MFKIDGKLRSIMSLANAFLGYTSPELFVFTDLTVNQSIVVVPKCYYQLANKI